MKKTTVDLDKTPEWVIGKWYYIAKKEIAEWNTLDCIEKGIYYSLAFSRRTASTEGKHERNDPTRNVLEPWEAKILYPECKDTAPDGVDWSAPELTLPKCLTKDEFEALEGDTVIFWCGNRFVLDGPKNGLDFWSGSELESAFFLTKADAETFKELYEADEIEFSEGTWVTAGTQSEISKLRTLIQFLEAKNTELLAENQSLEYANNILKNDCDSYEKETIALRDVVDLLTAQNESMATTFDGLHSKFDKAVHELTLAKEIIANLAIRLQNHENV